MNELVPGPELSRQLLEAERDCYVAWAEALAATAGNPLGASVHRFGAATVVLCPGTAAQIVNRVFGLTSSDARHIADICAVFDRHHVPVSIDVDMYGSRRQFAGRISGFTMGTGSTLALLPPQNATGNFVKVTQRVPVKIDIVNPDQYKGILRAGLSAEVEVNVK